MKAIISFEVEAPCECTEQQFLSWIKFETGQLRSRKIDDLSNEDFPVSFISDISELSPKIVIVK